MSTVRPPGSRSRRYGHQAAALDGMATTQMICEQAKRLLATIPQTMVVNTIACYKRLLLAIVGFFGFINLYALRVNISVAMVCMVNQTALLEVSGQNNNVTVTSVDDGCVARREEHSAVEGDFTWSKEVQGIILGSFFWGYLVTQIPGGWLANRFSAKRVFGYFMLMTAGATLLMPAGARISYSVLVLLRIIAGIGQGVAFPAMHTIWAKWAPPLERSKLMGFTYAGAQIGNVLTMPISGLLCEYGFDGGWPSIFYVLGTFGVLLVHCVDAGHGRLAVPTPPHQRGRAAALSREIQQTLICVGSGRVGSGRVGVYSVIKYGVCCRCLFPWGSFMRSGAVWAIVVAHTGSNWGTYMLLTNIPSYMREVLKFDIKSNGLFSAIPYICFWMCINIAGLSSDALKARGWRTKTIRKISQTLGNVLPAIFLVATGYVTCATPYLGVVLLATAVGFSGFQYSGFLINHVDIAPPFAGLLFGISNTAATLPGIIAPYTIGKITSDQTQEQWQTVFYVTAVIYVLGWAVYVLLAQGEVQPWADVSQVGATVDTKVTEEDLTADGASQSMLKTSRM
ncbi:Sialin [Lamellibrachia satsuma]|nr:Sialin [Lamellibrachia satsuma]